jgi:hypothetical protein
MKQFETNIYPTESQAFSVPPPRDGSKQLMTQFFPELSIPQNYYKGGRKKIITLASLRTTTRAAGRRSSPSSTTSATATSTI